MNILNDHDHEDAHDNDDTIKTSGIVPAGTMIKEWNIRYITTSRRVKTCTIMGEGKPGDFSIRHMYASAMA